MTQNHVRTDHQIQSAVVKELDWSAGVESEHIGVSATDGAVTLSGEVATLSERDAAIEAAIRVHCVIALVDGIVVKRHDGGQHDADIARAATEVLSHQVQLAGSAVNATVHDHTITLTGIVDWNYQREAARTAVASLSGVVEVVNRIALRATALAPDVEETIRAALVRSAQRNAEHIDLTVKGHLATLKGHVDSWKERREAELAVWSARGITDVHNDLVVAP